MLVFALSQAYDAHMNLILSEVEETISIVDVNDEGVAEGIRVSSHFLQYGHQLMVCFVADRNKADGDAIRPRRCSDHGEISGSLLDNVMLIASDYFLLTDCTSSPIVKG